MCCWRSRQNLSKCSANDRKHTQNKRQQINSPTQTLLTSTKPALQLQLKPVEGGSSSSHCACPSSPESHEWLAQPFTSASMISQQIPKRQCSQQCSYIPAQVPLLSKNPVLQLQVKPVEGGASSIHWACESTVAHSLLTQPSKSAHVTSQ